MSGYQNRHQQATSLATAIMGTVLLPAALLSGLAGCHDAAPSVAAPPAAVASPVTRPAAVLPNPTTMEITPRQVKSLRDAGVDFLLIDCRSPEEAARSRIAGSVLVPIKQLEAYLPLLAIDKQRPMVVYCTAGVRSHNMTGTLRVQGFLSVWSMTGGMNGWMREVEPALPEK